LLKTPARTGVFFAASCDSPNTAKAASEPTAGKCAAKSSNAGIGLRYR
jgi:hypothetical protein